LTFNNPFGISSGIDINAEYINPLTLTGCSFVEIGPVTPEAQNNNKGVLYVLNNLKKIKPNTIVAACITKNKTTDSEDAVKDYEKCFALLNDFVDMFIINLSGDTIEEKHAMHDVEYLSEILDKLLSLRLYFDRFTPILIKISDSIPSSQIDDILDYSMRNGIDGIVLHTNSYDTLLELVKNIHEKTKGNFPIIASGDVTTADQAKEILSSGATLIDLYSAFFEKGGSVIKNILKAIANETTQSNSLHNR
ncbi:MAG: hypothetical protein HUJ95_06470, partial [Bacteroidales bacterium]|nr:hypothetical protein [Bacteroidales bacterium]